MANHERRTRSLARTPCSLSSTSQSQIPSPASYKVDHGTLRTPLTGKRPWNCQIRVKAHDGSGCARSSSKLPSRTAPPKVERRRFISHSDVLCQRCLSSPTKSGRTSRSSSLPTFSYEFSSR
ncbi:hypothetical protein FA13DRAFT_1123731 [Coprinellus micaceus]|uniref:Uncharacterized protein n=1 Tax=Coprinellus micaceus TaxID=71717 RepID=A0A4Y7SVR9_COPMI|nr:hypothetical protein FA13DRAFT_1123731 [Coprinellus micaceus]